MSDLYVVEKRHADGTLDMGESQPPAEWIGGVSQDAMADWWFRDHPHAGDTAPSLDNIHAEWYHRFGWYVRPKTW